MDVVVLVTVTPPVSAVMPASGQTVKMSGIDFFISRRYSTHELAVLNSRTRCSIKSINLLRRMRRSSFVSATRDFA